MFSDMYGMPLMQDIDGMAYPMQCRFCGLVHDASKVRVLQRYSDCSVWKCPNCGLKIDDRPVAWGGSAMRVEPRQEPQRHTFGPGEFGGES